MNISIRLWNRKIQNILLIGGEESYISIPHSTVNIDTGRVSVYDNTEGYSVPPTLFNLYSDDLHRSLKSKAV